MAMIRTVLLAIVAVIAFMAGIYLRGCFGGHGGSSLLPPETIAPQKIAQDRPRRATGLLDGVVLAQSPKTRTGADSGAARAIVDSFSASVRDSSLPVRAVPFEGRHDGKKLTLWYPLSNGDLKRDEYRCPTPCEWGSAADSTYARHRRTLWKFNWAKDIAQCAAFSGAGYGIARAAGYDKPGLVAGVAGGGCALIKITD